MTIFLDKYGILIDGKAREGFILITHPDYNQPFQVKASKDYTGPIPTLHNTTNVTCEKTITSKLKLVIGLIRWLFSNEFKTKTSITHR